MEQKETVAKNLIKFRKKAGFSQLQLAKKLNYSNKNISKWENGETTPNIFILKQIADLYGIKVDDFFCELSDSASEEVDKNTRNDKRRKRIFQFSMLFLAIAILFAVASLVVYILGLVGVGFNKWLFYLYVSPLCALSVTIFIRIIYKFVDYISISIFGWLICLSIYLSLLNAPSIGLTFVLGAAYQFVVICVGIGVNTKLFSKFKIRRNKSQ